MTCIINIFGHFLEHPCYYSETSSKNIITSQRMTTAYIQTDVTTYTHTHPQTHARDFSPQNSHSLHKHIKKRFMSTFMHVDCQHIIVSNCAFQSQLVQSAKSNKERQ